MNILFVVPWDQEFGGVASVVGHLASRLRENGHTILFLHPSSNNIVRRRTTQWGFEGHQVRLRRPSLDGCYTARSLFAFLVFAPFTLLQLVYLLLTRRVHIVNVHYPLPDFFYFANVSPAHARLPVTSVHGETSSRRQSEGGVFA